MASLQSTAPGVRPAQSSAVARYGFLLAVLSAAAALSSALGHRFGLWHYSVGFAILRWSAYAGMAAALISLVGAVLARPGGPRQGFVLALLGIIIGLAVPSGPVLMLRKARQVPPIHDITTDTTDPPQFVAVLPLRAGAEDPSEYGGPEIAALQRKAYPQVLPLLLDVPPDKALEEATRVARDLGWQIVASVPSEGRLEATDTTVLWGFKDDVVVRIRPIPNGSRVDVRSVSRVGRSDLGVNAKRVESFLERLAKAN
jgi:uncharacterized protein (DUF1499 family)